MEIEGLNMELGTLLEMLQRVQSQVESGDMAYEQMTATLAKLKDMLAQTNNEAAKDAISQSISDIESQLNSLNSAVDASTQTQTNLRGSVNSTAGAFKAGNKALGAMGKTVAGVSSGMQTLGIVNETLGKSFGLLSTVMSVATSASAALKMALTAISSHPIMIAVTALIGGVMYLADKFDLFGTKAKEAAEKTAECDAELQKIKGSSEGAAESLEKLNDELKGYARNTDAYREHREALTGIAGKTDDLIERIEALKESEKIYAKEGNAYMAERMRQQQEEIDGQLKVLQNYNSTTNAITELARQAVKEKSTLTQMEKNDQLELDALRRKMVDNNITGTKEINKAEIKLKIAQTTRKSQFLHEEYEKVKARHMEIQAAAAQARAAGLSDDVQVKAATETAKLLKEIASQLKGNSNTIKNYESDLKKLDQTTTSSTTTHNNHSKTIKKEADAVSDLTKQLKVLDDQLKIDVVSAESELIKHQKVIEGLNAEMDAAEKALQNTKLTEEQKLAIQSKIADIGKKMTEENAKWENQKNSEQLDKYKQFQQDKLDVLEQTTQQSRTTAYDEYNKEAEAIQQLYDEGLISFEDYSDKREDAENKLNDKLKSIELNHSDEMVQVRQSIANQALAQFGENSDEYKQALNDLNQAIEDNAQKMADNLANTTVNAGKAMQTAADKFENIANHIQKVSGAIASLGQTIVKSIQDRIQKQLEAGEISQEQAEEEFEKTKATEIAITTITTLAGAAAAIASAWKDSTIHSVIAKAIIGATNAAAMLATGIAQINSIKSTTIGGGGLSGGDSVPIVTGAATPILNEAADVQSLQSIQLQPDSAAQQDQRVYILQSDITESNKQVNIRQTNSTF